MEPPPLYTQKPKSSQPGIHLGKPKQEPRNLKYHFNLYYNFPEETHRPGQLVSILGTKKYAPLKLQCTLGSDLSCDYSRSQFEADLTIKKGFVPVPRTLFSKIEREAAEFQITPYEEKGTYLALVSDLKSVNSGRDGDHYGEGTQHVEWRDERVSRFLPQALSSFIWGSPPEEEDEVMVALATFNGTTSGMVISYKPKPEDCLVGHLIGRWQKEIGEPLIFLEYSSRTSS